MKLTIYCTFWTAELIFFQLTIYHGISSDLPWWAAEFNEMPRGSHRIFLLKTVVSNNHKHIHTSISHRWTCGMLSQVCVLFASFFLMRVSKVSILCVLSWLMSLVVKSTVSKWHVVSTHSLAVPMLQLGVLEPQHSLGYVHCLKPWLHSANLATLLRRSLWCFTKLMW